MNRHQEMSRKTPAERLLIALELSDLGILLSGSARAALEKERAASKA